MSNILSLSAKNFLTVNINTEGTGQRCFLEIIPHYALIFCTFDTCAVLVGSQMVLGGGKITRDNPPRGDYVIAERYDVTTQTEPSEKAQDLSKYYIVTVFAACLGYQYLTLPYWTNFHFTSQKYAFSYSIVFPSSSLTLAPPPSHSPLSMIYK